MSMGNQVVPSGQHILTSVCVTKFFVSTMVDQLLVEAGNLSDMFVHNADIVGYQDNSDPF